MVGFSFITLAALLLSSAAANPLLPSKKPVCSLVNKSVTLAHEQRLATSYCSSYLHISPTCATRTVTGTRTITATAATTTVITNVLNTVSTRTATTVTTTAGVTVTNVISDSTTATATAATITSTVVSSVTATAVITVTSAATVTTTAVATVTTTAGATVTVTTFATVTATSSITTSTDSVVATSTTYTTTSTSTSTFFVTTISTSTSTSTETARLAHCTKPTFLSKRGELEERANPKPSCFTGFIGSSAISQACSCLSIPRPTTRTEIVSVSVTRTITRTATRTATRTSTTAAVRTDISTATLSKTQTATRRTTVTVTVSVTRTATISTTSTATEQSTVTKTSASSQTVTTTATTPITTTSTATQTNTVTATQSTTITVTKPVTSTVSLASTSTVSTTSTTSSVSLAIATATRYVGFALYASLNERYAMVHMWSQGYSADQGVFFEEPSLGSAATFSFSGTQLLHNSLYFKSFEYPPGTGKWIVEGNKALTDYGYGMDCSLQTGSSGGDGCELNCATGVTGDDVRGNSVNLDVDDWGLEGVTDKFTIYAVGQT